MLVTGTAPVVIIGLPCSAVISRILFIRILYVGNVMRPGSQPSQKSTARRAAEVVAHPQRIKARALRESSALNEQILVGLEAEVRNEQTEPRHVWVSSCGCCATRPHLGRRTSSAPLPRTSVTPRLFRRDAVFRVEAVVLQLLEEAEVVR